MTKQIRRKSAVRKFFAIPVTIMVGTLGAIYAAYIARLNIVASGNYDSFWLTDYWLAIVIGIVLSTFLAYTVKEFLKLRDHFKMEYILITMASVTLMTSTVSFATSTVFFFYQDDYPNYVGGNVKADGARSLRQQTFDDWSHRYSGDYLSAPIYQPALQDRQTAIR